ncbi:MAG TPA: MSMEG_0568 family radical SAM protein [Acidimicrobiales bacterium]|nr:MSMEG_0568 family radical SAM protein [Acidimicrobiales bacterium]
MLEVSPRADLAVRGVRVDAPVFRRGGAGPSDDGHLVVGGVPAAVPITGDSPWAIAGDGRLWRDGAPWVGGDDRAVDVEPVARPRFYDLTTADGIPYHRLARLHGADVLATTVVQTCVRYAEATRCRFCAIERSLEGGTTTLVKQPAQLAEVAQAAVRLDGVRQVVLTTGTAATADRGARHLARCTRAIRDALPHLPIQVQCEPPGDLATLSDLHDAGATAIGIHVESLDDEVRRRWTPGKATVPLAEYWAAWHEAVRVFGRNRVSTYLLVGLGEDADDLVAGARRLADAGVYPFVVPYRPLAGTLAAADGVPAPDPAVLAGVTRRVADHLVALGMRGADQGAGCAACGACSALPAAGG